MTIDEIKELIQVFNDSGVSEMEVSRGGNSLRLKRAHYTQEVVVPMTAPLIAAPPAHSVVAPPAHSVVAPVAPASASASVAAIPATVEDGRQNW